MSVRFEGIVVQAPQARLIKFLEGLPALMAEIGLDKDPFASYTFELYPAGRSRFVLFLWKEDARRPDAWELLDDLADELSSVFDTAVAVHYDNMVGVRNATLTRDGEAERYYGLDDEVWVPYGADGQLVMNGARYTGNTVPKKIDCDCIRNAIDVALEDAGFHKWLTSEKLVSEIAYLEKPLWQRLGEVKGKKKATPPAANTKKPARKRK